jgi:hypothetical protein
MIQGLDYGSNPTSTLAMINTVTGAVNYVQQNLPFLNGLAIDSQGNIYLSEYLQNEIVKIAAGTGMITAFASLADAGPLAIGPDGRLYAVGAAQDGTDQIWSYDLSTGGASLYASNLPALSDIAFAPGAGVPNYSGPPVAIVGSAAPEPSTVLMMLIGLPISLSYGSRWTRSTKERSLRSVRELSR